MKEIIFIGDSHITQYNYKGYDVTNFGIEKISEICIPGSSIKGLLNKNSTTGLNEKIKNLNLNEDQLAIFVMGQCDIEFGYYYKSVICNTKLNFDDFVDNLINKYKTYLLTLNFDFIITGINPCTVCDIHHNFWTNFYDNVCYETNILNETGELNQNVKFEDYEYIYNDSFIDRNNNHKKFNEKLKIMCHKNNFKYIDIWNEITIDDVIKPEFKRSDENHHLIESVELLEILLTKMKKLIII